jgi:hypothetical protein
MGFLSGLGKIVHKVTRFADKALSFVKAPLDFVTKPLIGLANKLLDKLPFGIGKFIEPFADKFLSSAIGWVAGGPLGGLASMITGAASTVQTVDNVLHVADGVLNGGLKSLPQEALENAQNLFSFAHAQTLFA